MDLFANFTASLWKVFIGNLLLVFTCGFYIAWWTVIFKPNGSGNTAVAGVLIGLAFLTGVAGLVVISPGIYSLSQSGKGFPLGYILIGAVISFVVLLAVTRLAFHRPLTSELFLMVFWAALELCAIIALRTGGRFGRWQTITLIVLVALATMIGIVCYVLYYRLDESMRFLFGLVPLIADGVVVLVFLVVMAVG